MSYLVKQFDTSFGPLSVGFDDEIRKVVRSGFFDEAKLLKEFGKFQNYRVKALPDVDEHVLGWLDGDIKAITRVETFQAGSDFRQSCYRIMRKIPAGKTWSYKELAEQTSSPKAHRAVGSACAQNQVAPFVPCHRVIGSKGEIGNYLYSKARKKAILQHEGGI